MTRLGVRARLTAGVTLLFFLAATGVAVLGLSAVRSSAQADGRTTAERVLASSLVYGPNMQDWKRPELRTRFFYLDPEGQQISRRKYLDGIYGQRVRLPRFPVGGLLLTDRMPTAHDRGPGKVALAGSMKGAGAGAGRYSMGMEVPVVTSHEAIEALGAFLWWAVPLATLVVGAITWLTTGWALRPVERIRAQTARISASSLSERVPEPTSRDEVWALATTMNQMLARLEEQAAKQRRFVSDASHDLRSPVAASTLQLEVGLAAAEAADWPRIARTVLDQQLALGGLIDTLFALARADEQAWRPGEVDLDDVVRAECALPRRVALRLGSCPPARVLGDPELLARTIRNIIDNAEVHAGTAIDVAVGVEDRWVQVIIDDAGPGIPPDQRRQVLERFVRLEESRTTAGSGLGLAIADQVVRSHGGDLAIESSPQGGTRVRLRLPLAP